jgi:hypothetical protein
MLDEYLQKSNMKLGELYDEFLRWVIGSNKPDRQVYLTSQIPGDDALWQKSITVDNSHPKQTSSQSIPGLGIRIFKVFNTFNFSETVSINLTQNNPDLKFYLCKEEKTDKLFYRTGGPSNQVDVSAPFIAILDGGNECYDVLCINQSLTNDHTASIEASSSLNINALWVRLGMYTASNGGKWLDYGFSIDEYGNQSSISWTSKNQDVLKFTGTGKCPYYPNCIESTVELEMNSDCSKIISLKVHAFDCDGRYRDMTTDFLIEDFPVEPKYDGKGRTGEVYGSAAWSHLKSFSQTGPSGNVSGVYIRDAGSIKLEFLFR